MATITPEDQAWIDEVRRIRKGLIAALANPKAGNHVITDAAIVALIDVTVMTAIAGVSQNRATVRDALSILLDKSLDDLTSPESLTHLRRGLAKYPVATDRDAEEIGRKLGMLK